MDMTGGNTRPQADRRVTDVKKQPDRGGCAMYHERQHLMRCALHALNNLFQEAWADRALMERLSLELYHREAALRAESGMRCMIINPFKSVVPLLGDYDINVVIEALKLRDCRISLHVVFNSRDPKAYELALERQDWESTSVRGVIVNFVCRSLLWGTWVVNHFYAIVRGPDRGHVDRNTSPAEGGMERLALETDGEGSAEKNNGGCGCESGGGGEGGEGRTAETVWYSLDSRLPKPLRLGGTRGLIAHLSSEIREHRGHVFVVGDGLGEAVHEAGGG